MVAKKFKSFAVTVRPRDGADDLLLKEFQSWFEKQQYIYAVTEKDGSERHIHFQMWCDDEKYISDVKKQTKRICQRKIKDWDKAQEKHCVFVKAAYTNWYEDYLEENPDKPEEVNELISKLPDNPLEFYPSEEEDERMKAANDAVDKTYHELNEEFKQYLLDEALEYQRKNECLEFREIPVTKRVVALFLHKKQNIDKTMKVIREQRVARAMTSTLYTYHTGEFDESWYLPEVECTNKQILKAVAQLEPPELPDLT